MSVSYQFWQDALAGKAPVGAVDDPQVGFYRRKRRDGSYDPVAIYHNGEGIVARVGQIDVTDINKIQELWNWCNTHPLSEEQYRAVAEEGKPWHDIDPTVHAGIGHNAPPSDLLADLRQSIAACKEASAEYSRVTSDEQQAKAQSLRARLNELSKQADNERKRLKQPHLDAGKAVDDAWQPLVKEAIEVARGIALAMGAWEDEKAKLAAKAAAETQTIAPVSPSKIKGAYGRAGSIRVTKVITITDIDVVFQQFREDGSLRVLLTALATDAVNAGQTVAGVTVEDKRVVR